jgi:hypothetical protein
MAGDAERRPVRYVSVDALPPPLEPVLSDERVIGRRLMLLGVPPAGMDTQSGLLADMV